MSLPFWCISCFSILLCFFWHYFEDVVRHHCLFPFPLDGLATCTQATGGASLSSSEEISSTGTTGRPLHLRSSQSDVCGTCSGTRGAVSLFLTQLRLPPPDPYPALTLTLPQHLPPLLPQLEPAEQDPNTPPLMLPTVPALCLNLNMANAACAQ